MQTAFMPASGPALLQVIQQTVIEGGKLPTWIYQGATMGTAGPDNGMFTTDATNSLSTTKIEISGYNQAGSDSSWMQAITVSATIAVFRDNQGRTAAYTLRAIEPILGPTQPQSLMMTVVNPVGNVDWSGGYSIQFQPAQ